MKSLFSLRKTRKTKFLKKRQTCKNKKGGGDSLLTETRFRKILNKWLKQNVDKEERANYFSDREIKVMMIKAKEDKLNNEAIYDEFETYAEFRGDF